MLLYYQVLRQVGRSVQTYPCVLVAPVTGLISLLDQLVYRQLTEVLVEANQLTCCG